MRPARPAAWATSMDGSATSTVPRPPTANLSKNTRSLRAQDPTGQARLEIARLHNDLGAIYGRKADPDKSQNEHRLALAILQENSSPPAAETADTRFELARTYYLLGRGPDRQSNPGAAGGQSLASS